MGNGRAKASFATEGFAKILTGVSILLIFSGLLVFGYTFNEMYLTNSKQEAAQEKLAAIYNGQQNFENNEEVFASESNFLSSTILNS